MNQLIVSVIVLGGLGIIAGIVIAICSKLFYVAPDTRIKEIFEMLPHYNCGACSTPGCMAMAEELVEGTIKIEKCRPSTPEQKQAIKQRMKELEII